MNKYLSIFTCLFLIFIISCSKTEIKPKKIADEQELTLILGQIHNGKGGLDLYKSVWSYYVSHARYRELYENALEIYGNPDNSPEMSAYSAYYLALACTFLEDYGNAEVYLETAFNIIKDKRIDNKVLNGMLNEIAGIFILKKESNYAQALDYFTESYNYFRSVKDSSNMCINLINMSEMYLLRNDTSGISYTMKAYELSKGTYFECPATTKLALMYSLKGDNEKALKYTDEAISLIENDSSLSKSLYTYTYLSFAKILFQLGDRGRAEHYFKEAEKYIDYSDVRTRIRYYVTYADFTGSNGNYSDAIDMYKEAEKTAAHFSNREFNHSIYIGTARSYDALGDSSRAMEYYKRFVSAYDHIINFNNEQELQSMRLKYEKENFQLRIDKEENKNMFLFIIVIVVVSASLYVFFLYKKQHRLYKNIVSQYSHYRQDLDKIKEVDELKKNNQMKSMAGMYDKLEYMMNKEKIYRRSDITIQNISERLGSNTTYVSNMINQFSGKTFPNYINSYRIKEVVEALSDTINSMPVKDIFTNAGFYSAATAYRVFQKEVGCTPNKFREQIHKLQAEKRSIA